MLIYLAFPDPYTPFVAKLPALFFIYGILSAPSFLFYGIHLRKPLAVDYPFRATVLSIAAFLFLLCWVAWTPTIIKAARSDALGALYAFVVPISQVLVWILGAISLKVASRTSA
ncbi:MAG: hypothetical protein ABIT76_15290 [Chthoniobacterales bacterium]